MSMGGEFFGKNSSRFIGNWINYKQHGEGEGFRPSGTHYEEGYFEKTRVWIDQVMKANKDLYKGEFSLDQMNSVGSLIH